MDCDHKRVETDVEYPNITLQGRVIQEIGEGNRNISETENAALIEYLQSIGEV